MRSGWGNGKYDCFAVVDEKRKKDGKRDEIFWKENTAADQRYLVSIHGHGILDERAGCSASA